MHRSIIFLSILLILFLSASSISSCSGEKRLSSLKRLDENTSFIGRVVRVIDGDTIKVRRENSEPAGGSKAVSNSSFSIVTVRLVDIDAPEHDQLGGPEAQQYLSRLILDKQVLIKGSGTDRYHRILGDVYIPGYAESISSQLICAGYAWNYTEYSKRPEYASLQEEAKRSGLGLWSLPLRPGDMPGTSPVAPWDFRKGKKVCP